MQAISLLTSTDYLNAVAAKACYRDLTCEAQKLIAGYACPATPGESQEVNALADLV